MNILKTGAKIIASAALVTVGTSSVILKSFINANADKFNIDVELLENAEKASFNKLTQLWSNKDIEKQKELNRAAAKTRNTIDNTITQEATFTRKRMAEMAYRTAQQAQKRGDMEKYQLCMEKYNEYKI